MSSKFIAENKMRFQSIATNGLHDLTGLKNAANFYYVHSNTVEIFMKL